MITSFWSLFLFCITISIVHGENVTSFSIVRRQNYNNLTRKNPKRANLKNCFKAKIQCYVGNQCLDSIPLKELFQTRLIHIDIKPVDNSAIDSPQRIETIETCNVGIVLTDVGLGRYEFEYHTTADNVDLTVQMNDYKIILDGEMDDLFCEPDCEITMNMKESVRWSDEKFFTGHIELPRHLEDEDDSSMGMAVGREESNNGDSLPLAVLNKNNIRYDDNDKKGSEEESSVGTILIVCAASIFALILIGVIVGIAIQCRQTTKSARRQAAVQTGIHKAASRPKSNEHNRKERTPLISSTTTISSVRSRTW